MAANLAGFPLKFPALPSRRYQGAPVYFEPMMGSGEWLTALVAIVGAEGARVTPAVRPTAIRAMYGAKSIQFSGHVSLIQESLLDHLERVGEFAGWCPPLFGARLGEARTLLADDDESALRQLIVLHASLSAVDEADEEDAEDGLEPVTQYWWKDIKAAVAAEHPTLAERFHVKMDGRVAGYKFRLGFFDRGLAAHFGLARPERLRADGKDLKAKLWELQSAKRLIGVREASLILCEPIPSPLYGPKQLEAAQTLVREIRAEAGDLELSLCPVTTTEQAAKALLDRLAA